MSKQFVRLIQHRGKGRKKGDTAQLAAQLAPLEEQNKQAAQKQGVASQGSGDVATSRETGAIVVDNSNLILPKDISGGSAGRRFLGIEPVVLVIVILMLGFIAFIAWQISLMPAQ